ncbi:unnamed protein product [Choristocarpus tenellus]
MKDVGTWFQGNQVEFLAGITTGLTAVPTAVAFAILAGVQPSVGLRGTWIIMLIMAIFGGRTGMVYSNSGSMGVVLEPLVEEEGTEAMFYAFVLAGIIQVVLGFLGVAKLLRLMPVSVMIGFVNGLAIVLFLAQMKNFQTGLTLGGPANDGTRSRRLNSFSVFTDGSEWIEGEDLAYTLMIVFITMVVIVVYPKLTERIPRTLRALKYVPPILVGIIVATIVEWSIVRGALGVETNTLENVAKVSGSLPNFAWLDNQWDMPPLDGDTFSTVVSTAISLMAVGLVESLMTVRLVNEITQSGSNIHREAILGGVGNFVAGIFGGQGGNSEIGLTMVNLGSGGRTRIAATTSGLLVLVVVLVAYPLINLIPLAGLVGVMLVIAFRTFDWGSLLMVLAAALPKGLRGYPGVQDKKIRRADALIIVVVTVATPFTNLAIAVGLGILVALLAFVWQSGDNISARTYYRPGIDVTDPAIIKVYEIVGPLFFASSDNFLELFDHHNDPDLVELHFHTADIIDYSAMQTLRTLGERYGNAGKRLRLRRIKKESLKVITKASALMAEQLEVDLEDNPELPGPAHRLNIQNAHVFPFFEKEDGFGDRFRRKSMDEREVKVPHPSLLENGEVKEGNNNRSPIHVGHLRQKSAEV